MHFKDSFTAFEIGFVDGDLPVETTRTQQGSIENVGRLVAARTMIPLSPPKPSISTSSWLRVLSLSSLLMMAFLPRARPMASISSMKMTQGAFSRACLNRSRTRLAPTPTKSSTKSEPLIEKKGTWASPAIALARRVLPVPGGPTSRAPLGILPPRAVYFLGFFRKSTISITSTLASSRPGYVIEGDSHFGALIEQRGLGFADIEDPAGSAGACLAAHFSHQHHPDQDDDQQRQKEIQQRSEPFAFRLGIDGYFLLGVFGKIIPQQLFILLVIGDMNSNWGPSLLIPPGQELLLLYLL
jgi:hypothetical protein